MKNRLILLKIISLDFGTLLCYNKNMLIPIPETLKNFASKLSRPLYVVGGYVRNFLIAEYISGDIDLTAPILLEDMVREIDKEGFAVLKKNDLTGTIVFTDGKITYEYTAFRTESYKNDGFHTPVSVDFTEDIYKDALRRDFTCNAVYYDILRDEIIDPTGKGLNDIKEKRLACVRDANLTFSEDGLRLLRLARFSAELNFSIDKNTLNGAKDNAKRVLALTGVKVFSELKRILVADTIYPFSNKQGHYDALKILDEIGVLEEILPEITLGRGMRQRRNFHKHDVLEHTLRCVLYSDSTVRLSALLHDVGKPVCMMTSGDYFNHHKVGEILAQRILLRFGAPKSTVTEVCRLVRFHMKNADYREEKKVQTRKFVIDNNDIFDKLLCLKQADFMAGAEKMEIAPSVKAWQMVYADMIKEKVPFSKRELKISSADLQSIGITGKLLGEVIGALFLFAIEHPNQNEKEILLERAKAFIKENKK